MESRIVSVGGHFCLKTVAERYNLLGEPAKSFPQLSDGVQKHCSVNFDNIVYIVGGEKFDGTTLYQTSAAAKLNLNEERLKWNEISSLVEKRSNFGCAIYDNSLVVAGGYDGDLKGLASVETYAAQENQWKAISPLKQSRFANTLLASDGALYAIGGWGNEGLSSVERLSSLEGAWEFSASLQVPRAYAAAVTCQGVMYVIGGRSDSTGGSTLRSVEKYDAAAKRWVYVSAMKFQRTEHSACVMRDKIYVMGGQYGTGTVVKEIECYDPSNDTWEVVSEVEDTLFRSALFTV